jgi:hypothetical protein
MLAPYLALLARCKAFAGELDVADALYRASLECEPAAIENVRAFAYFLAARGEREAALLTIEHLIGLEDTLARELTSASAPERRRRAFFARLWNTVDAFLTLARPEDTQAAWELVVRRLGQHADEMRSERIAALRGAGRQVLQDLGVLRAQIARAVIASDTGQIERLRDREEELQRLLAGYRPGDVKVPNSEDIAAALPTDATLITYVLTRTIDFAAVALGKPSAPREGLHFKERRRYSAFVIKTEQLRMIDLGPAEDIEAN